MTDMVLRDESTHSTFTVHSQSKTKRASTKTIMIWRKIHKRSRSAVVWFIGPFHVYHTHTHIRWWLKDWSFFLQSLFLVCNSSFFHNEFTFVWCTACNFQRMSWKNKLMSLIRRSLRLSLSLSPTFSLSPSHALFYFNDNQTWKSNIYLRKMSGTKKHQHHQQQHRMTATNHKTMQ